MDAMRTRLVVAMLSVLALAGCGSSTAGGHSSTSPAAGSTSTTPTTSPTTTPVPTPAVARFRISGRAHADGPASIAGVAVVFKLATARRGCQACDAYSAVTGSDGRYSMDLPEGQYVGGCALSGYTCSFAIAPADRFITLKLTSGWTGDLLLTSDQVTPSTTSTPTARPAPPSNQPDLSGHVYDRSGRPVPDAAIEIKMGDLNQHAFTDRSGYYEIDRIQMTGTLFCAEIGSCTAVHVAQPITVSPGEPPRVINWIDG